jgi:hypothetical protein
MMEAQLVAYNSQRNADIKAHLLLLHNIGFEQDPTLNPYHQSKQLKDAKATVSLAMECKVLRKPFPHFDTSRYSLLTSAPNALLPHNIMYRPENDDKFIQQFNIQRQEKAKRDKIAKKLQKQRKDQSNREHNEDYDHNRRQSDDSDDDDRQQLPKLTLWSKQLEGVKKLTEQSRDHHQGTRFGKPHKFQQRRR